MSKVTDLVGPLGPWMPPRSEEITITPVKAFCVLEDHNPRNRKISDWWVDQLADSMRRGHWQHNGETIVFAHTGVLIDGQHRLAACVNAETPFRTWVVFGVDPSAFATVDLGKPRRAYDYLSMKGETNTTLLQSTLGIIRRYDQGLRSLSLLNNGITPTDADETLAMHPGIRESVHFAAQKRRVIDCTPRVLCACHYLMGIKNKNSRDIFFDRLATGADLETGNPIHTLRERLLAIRRGDRRSRSSGSCDAFVHFHLMIRAWNAWRQDKTLAHLQITTHELRGKKVPAHLPDILP